MSEASASLRLGAWPLLRVRLRARRDLGNLFRSSAFGPQSGGHSSSIRKRTVLAALELADDTRDGDLDADDGFEHRLNVVRGCIAHVPGLGASGLVDLRQRGHELQQPVRVLDETDVAADVDSGVVPGGHYLAVLALARVPGGRDIAVRAREDREHRSAILQLAPQRIGARDVSAQYAGSIGR